MSEQPSSDFLEQIFQAISADTEIPPELKITLLRLQLPLHKLSLVDTNLISNEKHPARQTLFFARQLAHKAKQNHATLLKINHIISNLIQSEASIQSYSIANQRLQCLFQPDNTTTDKDSKSNSSDTIRQNINQQIKMRLKAQSIPHDCKSLILKLWPTALLQIAVTHGFKSRQLYNAFENYSELVESVQAIDGIDQYKNLKSSYLKIARKSNNLLMHFHNERVIESSIKSLITFYNKTLGSSNYGEALKNLDKISVCDKLSSLPESVKPGSWCELFIDEATPKRKLKLSFIDIENGKLIFVNRNGLKILEKDAMDFSAELERKQSRVIDHRELFSSATKTDRSLRKTS